jgi:Tol biopolymer transport system component
VRVDFGPGGIDHRRIRAPILAILALAFMATIPARSASPSALSGDAAIAFYGGRDGAIYVVGTDGHGLRRVASPAAEDGASWSPNGTMLAYSDGEKVHVVEIDTGRNRTIGRGTSAPVWSADGQWLAFEGPAGGPVLSRVDGSSRKVIGGVGGFYAPMFWSPDGLQLAVADANDSGDISIVNRDGPGRRTLPVKACEYFDAPAWSPDGTVIAYVTHDGRLALIPSAGSGFVTRAEQVSCEAVAWSPDGQTLAFLRRDGLWLAPTTTGAASRRLGGRISKVSWSPDGRTLAFERAFDGLYVMPATTGKPTRVGSGTRFTSWSPDGQMLAYVQDLDVWIVRATGSGARRITQGWRYGYGLTGPQWNPAALPVSSVSGAPAAWSIPTDSDVSRRILRTRGRIGLLAADGGRVAVSFVDRTPCVELWNTASGRLTRFFDGRCIGGRDGGEDGGTLGLAVGHARIAWLDNMETNHSSTWLNVASESVPAPLDIIGYEDVAEIGAPSGDGALIAFPVSVDEPPRTTIARAGTTRSVPLRSFPGRGIRVLAVDRGRILIRLPHSRVAVLRSDGRIEATIAAGERPAVLAGARVVVQRGSSLVVHALPHGAVADTGDLPVGATLVDAKWPLVVAVGTDRTVTVVHISDDRRATFRPPGAGRVLAQIEPAGLIIATTVKDGAYRGRVELVPWATVMARLR